MRAEVPYDQREGSEAKTSHHRGLESPIAFAQQDTHAHSIPVSIAAVGHG